MDASKYEACIENCTNMFSQLSPLSLRAWDMFIGLRRKRRVEGMAGIQLAIQDSELLARYALKGIPRFLWEPITKRIEILDIIDLNYLNAQGVRKPAPPPLEEAGVPPLARKNKRRR